jgi:hypothetical protein
MLFLFSFILFNRDEAQYQTNPIYYSPWVLPIYKYKPKLNDVQPHRSTAFLMYLTIFILFIWGIITAILVRPVWVGIVFVALAQIMAQ